MISASQPWRHVLNLLLPPHCPGCGEMVEAQGQLCAVCFAQVGFVTKPFCRRCGLPLESEASGGPQRMCMGCRHAPPPWRHARAALLYDGQGRSLILALKHAGGAANAAILARHMARAGARMLVGADLLVPVPLHRRRLLQRGFNQSALLAQHVGRETRIEVCVAALCRTRATPPLGALTAEARRAAMVGAVAVRRRYRDRVRGRRVVLVDDVLTSGATAAACTHALLDAGASNIDVLVASRVPAPHDD